MAYRKKAGFLLTHNPDIVIVPECENPERLKFGVDTKKSTQTFWYGEISTKASAFFLTAIINSNC